MHSEILNEEREKQQIQRELAALTEKLHRIKESLAHKSQAKAQFGKTIKETEGAYSKIIESSQTLLHVLQRESKSLIG